LNWLSLLLISDRRTASATGTAGMGMDEDDAEKEQQGNRFYN